ncbi:hypothetical protein LZ318_16085 [Saccharopolyspora indica]|uniref:hypothetical protein n=1 Tax=Saccharopolyspora indica TaxID=1229659 RepID=UPI0022EAC857|nr:hypothetical protein [Saccharopolyspora indica]MDA3645899.1 hypothetical protein [Saccharopolyspora indica]
MKRKNIKRGTLAGAGIAIALVAAGGVAFATAGGQGTAVTDPGSKPVNLRITAVDYEISHVGWSAEGQGGLGTLVEPNSVVELRSYDWPGHDITDEQFYVTNAAGERELIASYPQPADGQLLDCVASGTADEPEVECTSK